LNNLIIFVQAPADVIHLLKIYEKEKDNKIFFVYCINVKFSFDYIKKLNLDLKVLDFIPYNFKVSFRNIFSLIGVRLKLKSLFKSNFEHFKKSKVLFFSPWYDWITFYLLDKLVKNNNQISYYQHYLNVSTEPKKIFSIKERIILFKYKIMTGINLSYANDNLYDRLLFNISNYQITKEKKIDSDSEIHKYLYKPSDSNKNSILLLETNLKDIIDSYSKTLISILKIYKKKGFEIIVKGHPRNGFSQSIKTSISDEIPKYIPAELVDISSFDYVIGIHSFSLCYFSKNHNKVYSIINSFDFNNKIQKNETIKYLEVNSEYQIKFSNPIS